MQYTSASKSAFYINSNLIIVAILSFFVFKEQFRLNKILSVLLAIVGMYFLSIGLQSIQTLFSGQLKGDLLVLSSGVSWAFFMIINKKMVHRPEYSVLETVALFLFTSAFLLLPVVAFSEPIPLKIAWQGLALLCFTSIISMAIPFLFLVLRIKRFNSYHVFSFYSC